MHIAQFLDELLFGEDIEVEKALLPKMILALCKQPSRHGLFQHLHHHRRISLFRFADHEMKMLGHDHIADHVETISCEHMIQHVHENVPRPGGEHQGFSPVTTAGDVVIIVESVDSDKITRHAAAL